MKIKSIYVNGRVFRSAEKTFRSAKVVVQLDNDQWIKYKYREENPSVELFCENAIRNAENYIAQTYVAEINWRVDKKMYETDWTEVQSESALKWEPVPNRRDTIFPIRIMEFDEQIIIDRSKIKEEL